MRLPKGVTLPPVGEAKMYAGKSWFELDEEGHQRYPGDYEAQVGQGAITFHSEEHLASSDRGVSMFRKQYREAIRTVMEDGDPINAAYPREDALITLRAGNFLIPAAAVAAD